MKVANPIEDLIAAWLTRQAFADDIGANVDAVHKWARSGRIPSGWQKAVSDAARRRGIAHADADWMLAVHANITPAPQPRSEDAA